jgi:hypothetical protein
MKAELVPSNGDPPIPIVRDVTVLGRRDGCDVLLNHHGASKRHCLIVRTDGLLVVRDLASTNGTKVNGQRVRWAALLPNDRISFAGYKCRVYLGPDDAPAPSERRASRPDEHRPKASQPATGGPRYVMPNVGFPPPSSPEIIPLEEEDLTELQPTRQGAPPQAIIVEEDELVDSDEIIALD